MMRMMRMMRAALVLLTMALWLLSARVDAQDPKAQAKEFYAFGARAYEAGQFRAAARAFDEAYKLVPKPALLFSAGQALRRQYAVDRKSDDMARAIDYYRRYLAEMKEGGRRAEAAEALAELEPKAEKLGMDPAAAPAPPAAPQTGVIMVSSNVKTAKATLDGKAVAMPISAEVAPGKHTIRLRAPGWFDGEREVSVARGTSFLVHIPLKRRPARLSIETDASAEVLLDGDSVGATPLSAPLEVEPGTRRLVLLRTGHEPYVADLELTADRPRKVTAELEVTKQRYAAYVLLGVGIAGVAVGGVMTGLAYHEQGKAQGIDDARQQGNIIDSDREAFDDAIDRRDVFRLAATVAFAGGGIIGVTGVLLYVFDAPKVADPRAPRKPEAPAPVDAPEAVDMSFVPAAPGATMGGSVMLRF